MKLVILAAGQGTRLLPLTNDKPKCMVKFNNKPIIDYILESAKECKLDDIAVICGYKDKALKKHLKDKKITFYKNERFDQTNMVSTFFCAKEFLDDDIIISYSDIIFNTDILKKLINDESHIGIIVDKSWKKLWSLRMDNPLDDAETFKVKDGKILELGKKPIGYDEIEGQYIGLIKIKKNTINEVIRYYESLDKSILYDGNNYDNMYMTTFIQMIIDNLLEVKPIYINGGWVEIDSLVDLKKMEQIMDKLNLKI